LKKMEHGEQQHIFYAHRGYSAGFSRSPYQRALTLPEMVIALALMTIVFAAIVPQFSAIRKNWDSKAGSAETLANGRVLMDHLNRNLSKAVKITNVSESGETDGYIQFEGNDGNDWRYEIGAEYFVEYGVVGSLSDLAGPVSSLMFSCYDACDVDANLEAPIDVNSIRFVEVQATFTNPAELGRDLTFSTTAYLRTNENDTSQGTCWQNQDVGDVGAAGSATQTEDGWTIEGSGYDIMYNTDEFHFVYQSLSGDGEIIARVASIENTGSYAKAGVMIRETLEGDSSYAGILVTPNNGVFFQYRTNTGGSTSFNWPAYSAQAPCWFKLTRSGNTFAGYVSSDGSEWTQVGSSVSISDMSSDVNVGMAVCGNNDGVLCTAEFDNINSTAITYETFTEAKVSSDAESISISTPGDSTVSMLGSWTSGLTHTAESGSNRLLIFTAHVEEAGAINLNSVTYGGQSMTKVIDEIVGTTYQAYVVAYILDEADIAAATSDTFVPNWSTTPDEVSYSSVFLSNVNQTTSVGATADNETASAFPDTITTSGLSTENGDMVIVAATCGNAGDYTVNNSFTEAIELDLASSVGVAGYKTATGANETPSVTHSGPNRQVIIGFVVQSGDIGGIEGDLLIAAVATDGDTSSSLAPPGGEGWTEIDIDNYSGEVTLGAWWKLAEASESASHQFTWTGDEQAYGWMMQFTGHDSSDPIDVFSAGGQSSSTPTSPAVTTTVNNCMIVRLGAFDGDDITENDPGLSGHTAITMDESSQATNWQNQDIGDVGAAGSATQADDDWTIEGSGYDIMYNTDEFHYVYQSLSGDGEIIARVASIENTGSYAKAGVMIRETLDGDSRYAGIFVTPNNGAFFQYRTIKVGSTGFTGSGFTQAPYWFKLNRSGNTFTGYKSSNGSTWTQVGSASVSMASDVYVGLAVCSNNDGVLCTAEFDNITAPATGGDTVSGGAGYVIQSSSGSSGTSNFSLGSSNEAQMLTLAIAPGSGSACGESIRP